MTYLESDLAPGDIIETDIGFKYRIVSIQNSVVDLEAIGAVHKLAEFAYTVIYKLNSGAWQLTKPNATPSPQLDLWSWEGPSQTSQSRPVSAPEPTCTCDIRSLSAYGCKCGYIEYERKKRQ